MLLYFAGFFFDFSNQNLLTKNLRCELMASADFKLCLACFLAINSRSWCLKNQSNTNIKESLILGTFSSSRKIFSRFCEILGARLLRGLLSLDSLLIDNFSEDGICNICFVQEPSQMGVRIRNCQFCIPPEVTIFEKETIDSLSIHFWKKSGNQSVLYIPYSIEMFRKN